MLMAAQDEVGDLAGHRIGCEYRPQSRRPLRGIFVVEERGDEALLL